MPVYGCEWAWPVPACTATRRTWRRVRVSAGLAKHAIQGLRFYAARTSQPVRVASLCRGTWGVAWFRNAASELMR